VVHRPADVNAFEFAVLAGLRALQLARGCTPRVNGSSKLAVIAQREIAERKVVRASPSNGAAGEPPPEAGEAGLADDLVLTVPSDRASYV
jgi:DNA-directed RNA polymerase subunit K/omega